MKVSDFIDNYYLIASSFSKYSELLYKVMSVGRPLISEEVPTAAVYFNKSNYGFIEFVFNPNFLEKLSWDEVRFICAHEILHILFNHGYRDKDNKLNKAISNIAQDVVINDTLLSEFGFTKMEIPSLMSDIGICLRETVFKDILNEVEPEQTSEYYFNKLCDISDTKTIQIILSGANGGTLDDHSQYPAITEEDLQDILEQALPESSKEEIQQAINDLKDKGGIHAGAGSNIREVEAKLFRRPKRQRKWTDLVRNIRIGLIKTQGLDIDYQWHKPNLRAASLDMRFMLPSIRAVNDAETKKWDLWLFQDVSGSCVSLVERFQKAALSIPTDVFNVGFHVFDDRVKEADLNVRKSYHGGGTSFIAIENFIQKKINTTKSPYPKLVWVITDGFGDRVKPSKPENWSWFLSADYKEFIPSSSKTFMLSQFEGFGNVCNNY